MSVHPASARITNTPAAIYFLPRLSHGQDTGLFNRGPSGLQLVNSETAKADVLVALVRGVGVAVRGAHVTRVVDPTAAPEHAIGGMSTGTLWFNVGLYHVHRHSSLGGDSRNCARLHSFAAAWQVMAQADA